MTSIESIRNSQEVGTTAQQHSTLIDAGDPMSTLENVDTILSLLGYIELGEGLTERAEAGYVILMRELQLALRSVYEPSP